MVHITLGMFLLLLQDVYSLFFRKLISFTSMNFVICMFFFFVLDMLKCSKTVSAFTNKPITSVLTHCGLATP